MSEAAVLHYGSPWTESEEVDRPSALRLELLRDSDGAEAVFFFPGEGGAARELGPLAGRLATPGRMFGCSYEWRSGEGTSVGSLAAAAVAAIRMVQPRGPYRLVAYSFGALVALEAAGQLQKEGEQVLAPILIDPYYDQKFWPAWFWWLAQIRRTRIQLAQISKQSPSLAVREFAFRARRLAERLRARLRGQDSHHDAPATPADESVAALRNYQPRPLYPGSLILVSATDTAMFGCRTAELWRGRSGGLIVEDVPGDHHELVRNPASLEQLARVLDRHLDTRAYAHRPTALVVTTFRWPITASLASALGQAGFRVEALCPRTHPMSWQTNFGLHRLPWRRPERTLKDLVARLDPDLVVPCDEPALEIVRSIGAAYRGVSPALSRSEASEIATAAGVVTPHTRHIRNPAELDEWIEAHGLPVVLKTDGSSGGRGVAIARDRAQAVRMWRRLSEGPGLLRSLKRALVNADASLLRSFWRGCRPSVHAQVHVAGSDANVALVVNGGKVLAAVAVEVLERRCENGPARLARVIDHPEILAASRKFMERLRLTGLVGIDFILDAERTAHLIELNARATPTCRLALDRGSILAAALGGDCASSMPPKEAAHSIGEIIDIDALAQLGRPIRRTSTHRPT